ncbi:cytochrome c biogenesis protein CcsA [Pontimicrobium sp. IMCC45349]|uniref:cytochrome c biogenesis protein n=1 Tax=Pontimicrobium sp. IMCC45349 TaxID=3391574 RepID=UPI0039A1771B
MKSIYKLLSSSTLALLLLLVYAVAMAAATFVENDFGTSTAWVVIYNSWWFELVQIGLAIVFIANIFKYKLLRKEKWAILMFHIAFIVIILGAGITRYMSYSGIMRIREGSTSNIVISDTNFLTATITDGTNTKKIREKIAFSPLDDNDFSFETTFNDQPVTISYRQFVADAVPEIVEAEEGGEPILQLVVTTGEGRNTVFLKKGEIERIGQHQHEVGFETTKEGIISIHETDGLFSIKAPHTIDFFKMNTQEAGKLVGDTLHPMHLRTLYRSGDFSFVPLTYHENGKFELISSAEKPKDNDSVKDDALVVNVAVGDKNEDVNILYREGFLPTHHDVELNNIRVVVSYGSAAIKTPFGIKLNDFQLERYPGSSSPSAYASEVSIVDNDTETPFRIYMNNVLDYKGFRFFQASYDTDERGTVLSVNHDRLGTIVTYIGYFLMTVGMFFTFFGKTSRFQFINKKLKKLKKKQLAVLLALFSLVSFNGEAQENTETPKMSVESLVKSQQIDLQQADFFGEMLVQDVDGRIKPINTLASEFLRKISRKVYFKYPVDGNEIKFNANQTFLALHMAPNIWQQIPIIKVDTEKTGTLFDDKTFGENGLIAFNELLDENGAYILSEATEEANQKKPAERSEFDKEILNIDERFNILYNLFVGNYLKIFPNKNDENNTWFSYTHHFNDFPEEDARFAKSILPSYFNDLINKKYNEAFDKVEYMKTYQSVLAKDIIPSKERINAELWYNKLQVNFWLFQVFFTFGLILLVLAIAKMFSRKKWVELLWNLFIILTLIAFICFTGNIILRWYVAQHAPWSNGYEMLIFVAWTLALCGLLTFRKSDFSLPLATLFSGTLLFVSYLDWLNPEITNLMPVLKSYWLKVHVATIVSSYAPLALSCILGLMALLLLLFKTKKNKDIIETKIKEISYINELSMTIGLFVLAIGTFLGGVWANESWGRYWAWDPKETWALISIIVYAIVLHLRFVPKLNNQFVLNTASMFAFWSIIMTSFGVNYYLSGLHSYASGDPVPIPKFVYFVAGFMIIIATTAFIKQKRLKA